MSKAEHTNREYAEALDEALLSGTGTVFNSIGRLAGAVAGLTVLSLICGYIESFSYLREIGAPWAASLITTSQLIARGGTIVGITTSMVLVITVMNRRPTRRGSAIRFVSLGLAIGLAFAALGYSSVGPTNEDIQLYIYATKIGAVASLVAGALAVFLTIGRLISDDMEWRLLTAAIMSMGLLMPFFFAPQLFSTARAARDTSLTLSKLSTVHGPKLSQPYFLVTALDSSYLVMTASMAMQDREFRVLAAEEITAIRPRVR